MCEACDVMEEYCHASILLCKCSSNSKKLLVLVQYFNGTERFEKSWGGYLQSQVFTPKHLKKNLKEQFDSMIIIKL